MRSPRSRLAAFALAVGLGACGGGLPPESSGEGPRPVSVEGVVFRAVPLGANASSTEAGYDAAHVIEYQQSGKLWMAAGGPPQWIAVDLGETRTLRELRLRVPSGTAQGAQHRVLGGSLSASTPIGSIGPAERHGDEYRLVLAQPLTGIRHLRVETTVGNEAPSWTRIEAFAQSSHAPRWFGYYADAFAWTAPATADVQDHINLSWISASADDTGFFAARLQAARDAGLMAAVALPEELFFADDLTLRPDAAQRCAVIADVLRTHLDRIAFLSPIDEPYSLGRLIGVPSALMRERLEHVGEMIHADFPDLELAFSFSALDFGAAGAAFNDLADPRPAGYNLFGFDCYGSWDACGDATFGPPRNIPWYVRRIGSMLARGQRMFLFADAFLRQPLGSPAVDPSGTKRLLAAADRFVELALTEPSVAGLFVFLYQDEYVEGGDRFLGVVHWPELTAAWRATGTALTQPK